MIQCAAHDIEPVLGLDNHLVKSIVERPGLLLFGQDSKEPLTTPVATRATNPPVENFPIATFDARPQTLDEIGKLRISFAEA